MSDRKTAKPASKYEIINVGGYEVRIDPTFKELLRPLNGGERQKLKDVIRADGRCIADLIAAAIADEPGLPILIDGHHRNAVVGELRSEGHRVEEPTLFVKEFATRYEAADYMASLQAGRRNWEPQDRIRFIYEKLDYVRRLKAEAAERKLSGKRQVGTEKSPGRVAERMAQEASTSPTTVKQVIKVLDSKNTEVIQRLFHADPKQRIAVAEAAKLVGSAQKAEAIRARSERLKNIALPPLPRGSALDKIICADVLNGLRVLKDESVQLTVTSPPYAVHGVPYDGHIGKDWYNGDYGSYLDWLTRVLEELYRVTQPNGRIVLNVDASNERDGDERVAHGTVHNVYGDISQRMKAIGWVFRGDYAWYKQSSVGTRPAWGSYAACSNPRIRRNHEYLLVFQKGCGSLQGDPNMCDLTQDEFEEFTISHWYIKPEQGLSPSHPDFHPVPFPQELVYRCVKLYSYVGATILDPFVGCGTTAFVAKALSRRFIGIDQSPLYCESAERWVKTLDGLKAAERLGAIKRFKIAEGARVDGYGRMEVDSIRARARKRRLRSRSV